MHGNINNRNLIYKLNYTTQSMKEIQSYFLLIQILIEEINKKLKGKVRKLQFQLNLADKIIHNPYK